MKVQGWGPERAAPIEAYESVGATSVHLGSAADGEGHAWCIRFEPGGHIGEHEAGYGQLFIVVEGEGWASGGDGRRVPLRTGELARIERGERHAKGSETGMTALMLQLRELAPPQNE